MRYLPDGTQMSAADKYTIEKVGIPSLVLMERAALKTVETMNEYGIDTSKALIVCGSGNNGGDGFAIARLLWEKGQYPRIFFAGKEASLSTECKTQKKIAENLGIEIITENPQDEYTVIIDAIFGVGLSREVSGKYADIISWMNEQNCRKVAVDIPSGVSSATGKILGTAFRAELTVAMACVKVGCELYPGKTYAGTTVPVPIGIDTSCFLSDCEVCMTYDRADIPDLLPQRKADSHKGSYGKVLMITGSRGMAGAAYLSAKAAYTAGAGLVRIYTAEENRSILQQLLPACFLGAGGGAGPDPGRVCAAGGTPGRTRAHRHPRNRRDDASLPGGGVLHHQFQLCHRVRLQYRGCLVLSGGTYGICVGDENRLRQRHPASALQCARLHPRFGILPGLAAGAGTGGKDLHGGGDGLCLPPGGHHVLRGQLGGLLRRGGGTQAERTSPGLGGPDRRGTGSLLPRPV